MLKFQPVTPLLLSLSACVPASSPSRSLSLLTFRVWSFQHLQNITGSCWCVKTVVAILWEDVQNTGKETDSICWETAHEDFCYSKCLNRKISIRGKKAAPNPTVCTCSGILVIILQQLMLPRVNRISMWWPT